MASLISALSVNGTSLTDIKSQSSQWSDMYERLLELKKVLEHKENQPGSKVYSMRMYDLVLDRKTPSMTMKQTVRII